MGGVVLEPVTSPEAIDRNLKRLNEAIVAMQGGSIAMENIVGYEDLATKTLVDEKVTELGGTVEKMKIPVGGRYYSTVETNPSELFGYGTWELVGEGRVEIGVGTLIDVREEEKTFAAGETGGEFNHLLTVDELPAHNHDKNLIGWQADGNTPNYGGGIQGEGGNSGRDTGSTGGDKPHNNMQPYEVIYKWERTE